MFTRRIHLLVISSSSEVLKAVETGAGQRFQRFAISSSAELRLDGPDPALPAVVLIDCSDRCEQAEAFVRKLRSQQRTQYVPVIFLAEQCNDVIFDALRFEATDFLKTPFLPSELTARLAISLRHHDAYRRLDQQNRVLAQLAAYDDLTGLYNRRYIFDALEAEARQGANSRGIGVFLIDLDNFKRVNDTCGHLAGDRVLVAFAHLLKSCLRSVDVVGRYGGDEFCMIKPDATPQMCEALARRLLDCVHNEDFARQTRCGFPVTPSIGIAYAGPGVSWSAQTLLGLADIALYKTKEEGRNSFVLESLEPAFAH